jgi:hypothetical protein
MTLLLALILFHTHPHFHCFPGMSGYGPNGHYWHGCHQTRRHV